MKQTKIIIKFLGFVLITAFIRSADSFKCGTYCYQHQSVNGQCHICYNECINQPQPTFNSCQIKGSENQQSQVLSQTLCKLRCYPQEFKYLLEEPKVKNPQNILQPISVNENEDEKENNKNQPATYTFDQLEKKHTQNNEGWFSSLPREKLLSGLLWLIFFQVVFILGLVALWRCISKRKTIAHLLQLAKTQKLWVKKFQKVQDNQSTISSPAPKREQTAQKTEEQKQ